MLNHRLMTCFHRTLNLLEVHKIQLLQRQFTWLNGQRSLTMTRIDRAFCTIPWEHTHLDLTLQALSSSASDHCPIHLMSQQHITGPPMFRFEAHWPYMPGFNECVQQSWNKEVAASHNPMMGMHIRLMRTSKVIAIWARRQVPRGKLAATISREIISQLEGAQETRLLSNDEQELLWPT
jgi:hypothetical protein